MTKTKLIKTALCSALLMSGAAQAANPVTIDFDDTLPTYFGTTTHLEDGFTLTSNVPDGTLIDVNNVVRGNLGIFGGGTNSQSLFWGQNGSTSTISLVNDLGLRFDLLSLDASSLFNTSGVLTLTGTRYADGLTVQQTVNLNSNLSTYAVTGMEGITDLTISYDGSSFLAPFDLDNINMSVIPIPAAVWLFGSALAGMFGWRRFSAS